MIPPHAHVIGTAYAILMSPDYIRKRGVSPRKGGTAPSSAAIKEGVVIDESGMVKSKALFPIRLLQGRSPTIAGGRLLPFLALGARPKPFALRRTALARCSVRGRGQRRFMWRCRFFSTTSTSTTTSMSTFSQAASAAMGLSVRIEPVGFRR
jgi:hypothetical protein